MLMRSTILRPLRITNNPSMHISMFSFLAATAVLPVVLAAPRFHDLEVEDRDTLTPRYDYDGWKDGWTKPIDYDDDCEVGQYDGHSSPPQHIEEPNYDRPTPTSAKQYDNSVVTPQPINHEEVTPTVFITSTIFDTELPYPQLTHPAPSTSAQIYAAPTTIYETRTFTYSYQEDGTYKIDTTTMTEGWTIENPTVPVVATAWVTEWVDVVEPAPTEIETTRCVFPACCRGRLNVNY
jgi:hypothetical protein